MAATVIICLCHRVTERDIAAAVRSGCDSFDALQDELRVATGCGAGASRRAPSVWQAARCA
jgi:bacterioferritin-associated ferredoxin